MRWLVLLLTAVVMGACATDVGPSSAELKQRWEQQNVYPQNYKTDLTAFLRTYLNDPTHIRNASVSPPQLKSIGEGDRYITCVRYTARKSGGQYAASKEGVATYVSGKLDRFFDEPRETRETCTDAAYEPFPELEALAR